ncbi:hypothetical protein SAMN06265377_1686 [Flagellimonas pacifica]|uniref:Uncharacterized protein n=1 Tax=Flagellimonas pacifica TaxID=1247520 RepID=A0A285MRR1_9FLAO|nr:hypothetical protein SAMN06265377_1686 [Allomuricauda parva]
MSLLKVLEENKLTRSQLSEIMGAGNSLQYCMQSYPYNGYVGCANAGNSTEGYMCLSSCNPDLV